MAESNREHAAAYASRAGRWLGQEPIDAQLATAHAILAVADELSALRAELAERLGATGRSASPSEAGPTGPAGDAT